MNEKDQKPVIVRVDILGNGYKRTISEVLKDMVLIKDSEHVEKIIKNSNISDKI